MADTADRFGGLLEQSPYDSDGGEIIGRDPRYVPASAFANAGVELLPVLKAIRQKCLSCSEFNAAEVRKCVMIKCALWPMRMGSFPKHLRQAMKDKEEHL